MTFVLSNYSIYHLSSVTDPPAFIRTYSQSCIFYESGNGIKLERDEFLC